MKFKDIFIIQYNSLYILFLKRYSHHIGNSRSYCRIYKVEERFYLRIGDFRKEDTPSARELYSTKKLFGFFRISRAYAADPI
jgi:hypothetical protein